MGTPQMTIGESAPTVPVDLFNKPQGNMLFVLEGFTADMLKKTSFEVLGQSIPIERTSRPYHPDSLVATAVTSKQPKEHGVFRQGEQLHSMNIFDLANGLYDGVTIVGAAISKSQAQVLSTHSKSNAYFLCGTSGLWKGPIADFVSFDKNAVLKAVSVDFEADPSIDTLLNEVSFVLNAAQVLANSKYQTYILSFQFSAPQLILAKYGVDSPVFQKAMQLIDSTIKIATKSQPSFQILYLPALTNARVEDIKNTVFPIVAKYLADPIYFPQIELDQDGKNVKTELCQRIRNTLGAHFREETNVFCALDARDQMKRAIFAPPPPGGNATNEDVYLFHSFFWIFLFVIAAALWAFYMIAFIEPDTGLQQDSAYVKKTPHQKWQ